MALISGWPYVVPTDKPLEYPSVSQQLAQRLADSDKWVEWSCSPVGMVASSISAQYYRTFGGLLLFHLNAVVTSVSAAITFTLPAPSLHNAEIMVHLNEASPSNTYLGMGLIGANSSTLIVQAISASTLNRVPISPTVPFTWQSGDEFRISGFYRCAPL